MIRRILCLLMTVICTQLLKAQGMYIMGYDAEKEYYGVFLGKITALDKDDESIWNTEGRFGDQKSSLSIWNIKGMYGSETSDYSPFNDEAACPPKIYDEEDNFYGYFTINEKDVRRCNYDIINVICRYHNNISVNVIRWYARIFGEGE